MDLYVVNMMSGASVVVHISLLHASIIAYARDPFSEFYTITVCVCRLLWSLPKIDAWVEFKLYDHDFMMTGHPNWDGLRFQI